ncbi:MAG: VCBS repeat-containing protein [Deltaproteobacteria bacterium]|nr:VCBS repeat-containing protein [Deltaproteobacteria bacterium]
MSATWLFRVRPTDGADTHWGAGRHPDLNEDGFDDLVMYSTRDALVHQGITGRSPFFIYHGAPQGLTPQPTQRLAIPTELDFVNSQYYAPLVRILDADGDGIQDLVTAPFASRRINPSRIEIYRGGEEVSPTPNVFSDPTMNYGTLMSFHGDVDSDGLPDLVFMQGERRLVESFSVASSRELRRSTAALSLAPAVPNVDDRFRVAGDVDGDGRPELVAGVHVGDSRVRTRDGQVTLALLTRLGATGGSVLRSLSAQEVYYVWSVIADGDLNGDGLADIGMVQSGGFRDGRFSSAALDLVVFLGQRDLAQIRPQVVPLTSPADDHLLAAYAVFGDFNGDGRDEVAIRNVPVSQGGDSALWCVVRIFPSDLSGVVSDIPIQEWRIPDCIEWNPVLSAADYDGDGFDDLALFEVRSTGLTPRHKPGFFYYHVTVHPGSPQGIRMPSSVILLDPFAPRR